jgi:hypothetical protein
MTNQLMHPRYWWLYFSGEKNARPLNLAVTSSEVLHNFRLHTPLDECVCQTLPRRLTHETWAKTCLNFA